MTTGCVRAAAAGAAVLLVASCGHAERGIDAPLRRATEKAPPAVAEARADWQDLLVQVVDATRNGAVLVVQLRFTNTSNQPFDIGNRFAAEPADRGTLADAVVIDASGLRKYFVLRDRANRPDSTVLEPIGPGEARLALVRFPAPPERTSRITIQIPHVPPLGDVPIVEPGPGGSRM